MKRTLLALTCLALALLAALIFGVGLGAAQTSAPLHDPRPSPTPDGLGPSEAPASPDIPPMPDLVVTAIEVVPSTPFINEQVTIKVTIKNQSLTDVPLGNSFYTDLYVDPSVLPIQLFQDGVYAWGCQSYWVPAGESYTLMTTLVFTDVRVYALWAQIDTDSQVAEANENNNVLGPFHVQVLAPNTLVHQTHQDFQMGVASSLDVSHPDGVMRRGIFVEPYTEPEVYYPDWQIDDPPLPPAHPNNVNQVKPALASNGNGVLHAVWEDGRNGGVFNRDIYFSRSPDGGNTWITPDVRVNDDPITYTVNQVSPHLLYDKWGGRLYAVWQDGRNGDFDIYFSYSDDQGDTWHENQLISIDPPTALDADQLNPSLALGPFAGIAQPAIVYLVWQDRRNGNDDVYLSRSYDGGVTWNASLDPNEPPDNFFVTDDPDMASANQTAPSAGVDKHGALFVCWEDWRTPGHPEIYAAWSRDEGETFGIDVPVDSHNVGGSYRIEPTMVVSTNVELKEEWDPVQEITVYIPIEVTAIHVAFAQFEDGNYDIYYTYAIINYSEGWVCTYPYDFCFAPEHAMLKASGLVFRSEYALPPDSGPTWPIEPSWKGQPSITLVPDGEYWTYCHIESGDIYSRGVFIAWSDGRSFDDWRYEIQTRRVASPLGDPESFDVCDAEEPPGYYPGIWVPDSGVLNDSAKIYAYRDNLSEYEIYRPAATGQSNPSIQADGAGVYVAWDDDREDTPLEPGTVRNRDVFASRLGMEPEGIYISPVIDSKAQSSWYVLTWWGVTENFGDLLLQTRFGTTPDAPQEDTEANGWTRWTGNPSSPYLGCTVGEGCYYDAPGRHIVDPDGHSWVLDCQDPSCPGPYCPLPNCPDPYRYIQYKVIIRGYDRFTALSQVKIYYKGVNTVYLPIVIRKH